MLEERQRVAETSRFEQRFATQHPNSLVLRKMPDGLPRPIDRELHKLGLGIGDEAAQVPYLLAVNPLRHHAVQSLKRLQRAIRPMEEVRKVMQDSRRIRFDFEGPLEGLFGLFVLAGLGEAFREEMMRARFEYLMTEVNAGSSTLGQARLQVWDRSRRASAS